MTSPNIVQGRLSLGSFIKLSVIAAIGLLPVLAIFYGLVVFISLARGHHSTNPGDIPDDLLVFALWPLLLLKVVTTAVSVVLSGFFAGLCGYPFYAWLSRRRGGIVLKGKFEVL
jgi:hypothetical protein